MSQYLALRHFYPQQSNLEGPWKLEKFVAITKLDPLYRKSLSRV